MNPRLNRIPVAREGGPNDDSEAEPEVVKCALCGDDITGEDADVAFKCPACGTICGGCRTFDGRCGGCGAAVEEEKRP